MEAWRARKIKLRIRHASVVYQNWPFQRWVPQDVANSHAIVLPPVSPAL